MGKGGGGRPPINWSWRLWEKKCCVLWCLPDIDIFNVFQPLGFSPDGSWILATWFVDIVSTRRIDPRHPEGLEGKI